ncbi:site-specific integrase [Corynebacterium hindlerae]|uniref:Site-specific integrase n=1 Tax=Corynebacterium hindlerae TaxID=699041 RepID=A0A7G5FGU5_9CORY|nr:site-specific integrase [Corynebacterium hindlerae]QMV85836.1 site-specific integrase [Corynebacterium hindlerae]
MLVTSYRPRGVPDDQWNAVRDIVIEVGKVYQHARPEKPVRGYMRPIVGLTLFCWLQGYDLNLETVFDSGLVEYFANEKSSGTKASKSSTHVTLRDVGRVVNSNWDGHRAYSTPPASKTTKPYTEKQLSRIYDWSISGNTATQTRERSLIWSLGLGAGLTAAEMCQVTWADVFVDDAGVIVHVAGRVIPVLDLYADPLREKHEISDAFVLRPRVSSRRPDDVVTRTLTRCEDYKLRPSVRQMRVTWIVVRLQAGVPDALLCSAAGLQSLKKYEVYRPKLEGDAVLRARSLSREKTEFKELRAV